MNELRLASHAKVVKGSSLDGASETGPPAPDLS